MTFSGQVRETYLFSNLTEEELTILESQSARIAYSRGDLIYKQGSFNSHAFYLLDGYAKIYLETQNAKRIVKLVKPNWFIGLLSIFSYENHRFSASALTDCVVRSIPTQLLSQLLDSNSMFRKKLIKEISLLGTNVAHFLVMQNSKNMRGKIAEIIIHLGETIYKSKQFDLNFTRREIGDLANTSTETAIRIIAELKNEGAIETNGNTVLIKDLALLEKISRLA